MPYPFDRTGTEVGPDGVRRYTGLPQNLLQMLRAAVDSSPDAEALVELGGERVTYRQLWDRAARVAEDHPELLAASAHLLAVGSAPHGAPEGS